MPPGIAPIQAVIIPIISKKSAEEVSAECARILRLLKGAGIRAKLDDRDARPGSKYYDWEIKGVPVRLEVGARDLENGVVSFYRRDTEEKGTISAEDIVPGVRMLLDVISESMMAKANEVQKSRIQDIDSAENIPQDKILRFGWCGCEDCGHKFEDTYGFKILGTPYHPEPYQGSCIICGKPVDKPAYAAHTM
jgi:prolyl-tRNA synthetase